MTFVLARILEPSKNKGPKMDDFATLKEFKDAILDKILRFSQREDVYFSI